MPEYISLRPVELIVNAGNPRLAETSLGQRDALRAIAADQGRKLLVLARSVVAHGLNPSELSIVTPFHDDLNRYLVLEGNRRLAVLRALENPEAIQGAVDDVTLRGVRELSHQYQQAPVERVPCIKVETEEEKAEARYWIKLRHTGENEGAGVVGWSTDQQERYTAREGGLRIHSLVLNYLEKHGHITPETRKAIPITTLRRLLETPAIRAKVGVELRSGELFLVGDPKRVVRALLYLITDITTGHDPAKGPRKVTSFLNSPQRKAYANSLPPDVVVPPEGEPRKASGAGQPTKQKRQPKPKGAKPRDQLIPSDCVLDITEDRVADIVRELRGLSLSDHTNAVAVLFRVFVELSIDAYVTRQALASTPHDKLREKMQATLDDLMKRTKLNAQQAKPVRRALSRDSYLAPSINLMHDFVHCLQAFPAAGDLRAHWSSLQPFFVAIWSQ